MLNVVVRASVAAPHLFRWFRSAVLATRCALVGVLGLFLARSRGLLFASPFSKSITIWLMGNVVGGCQA